MPDYVGRHRPPTRAERRARRTGARPTGLRAAYVLPTVAAAVVLTGAGFTATHQSGESADAAGQATSGTKGGEAATSSTATLEERQQEHQRAARSAERQSATGTKDEDEKWVTPVEDARVTSEYGHRWGRLHAGRDYGAAMDTPVRAMGDGKVVGAGTMAGYGNYVDIEYADDTVSRYGHLAEVDVYVSQWVRAGDVVARSGNSGRSTGPHLHVEIRPDGKDPVDPETWLSKRGID